MWGIMGNTGSNPFNVVVLESAEGEVVTHLQGERLIKKKKAQNHGGVECGEMLISCKTHVGFPPG